MLKRMFLCAVLLAFLVKALIPAGFMPGSVQAGTPVVICSDYGMKTIHIDENGQPVSVPSGENCTYSMNGTMVEPELSAAAVVPTVFAVAFVLQEKQFLLSPVRYHDYSPRGPPAYS